MNNFGLTLTQIPDSRTPTLCLNMIVKNESKIITRLFDSVVSVIDCYCICDTGSTDDTVQIIINYFNEKNIPGKVVHEPFQNFCHNRNFALMACVGMSDFVLLLDADMILEVKNFKKTQLVEYDAYNILQGSDSFYYQNLRIVKNDGRYKYMGVTHEYIDRPPGSMSKNIERSDLFIRDIGDGGSKQNKFERDVKLLLEGLMKEPNNHRYFFYLANSYHDLGRYNEAIYWYKRRIEAGGWIEEVWYSYYRTGLCYKKQNDYPNALWYWLEGYNFYPDRLEGLYEAIHYYRNNSKHKLGVALYKMCKEVLNKNLPRNDYLFLYDDVYTFLLHYEYTIVAAYCGIHNINDEAVAILNRSHGTEVSNLLSNMKFYKFVLNQSGRIVMDSTFDRDILGVNTRFLSSSSCLIPKHTGDGYYMNIRYVNYFITDSGSYINCDRSIITINEFVEMNKNLEIVKRMPMNFTFEDRRYVGVEDVRIFTNQDNNDLLYIGTGYHRCNKIGINYGKYDMNTLDIEVNELTQNFNHSDCEKNWLYVRYNGANHIIYNWHPLQICSLDTENHCIKVVETRDMPKIFSRARGSTCGFEYRKKIGENNNTNITISIEETEFWFVCHIVSYEQPRHYYHVICVFDCNMNLLRYSAPFKFEGECIEYCLSIVVEDEKVYINYSTWDRTTRIGVYDKKYIDSILTYE